MKILNQQLLWDKMANKEVNMWKYLEGMSLCYDHEHAEFDKMFR